MILQSLFRYYEILSKDPNSDIAPPGYSTTGVRFALNIGLDGELLNIIPLYEQVQVGKRIVERPRRLIVPEQFKRTSGVMPNFLCDNTTYVLGISDKDTNNLEYSLIRHEEFRRFNVSLLSKANCAPAQAVIAFLNRYDPRTGKENPIIGSNLDSLLEGGNLIFRFQGDDVHQDPEICRIWEEYKGGQTSVIGQCLVTGVSAPIARLHPSITGIKGAQSTGASLVGFNARAYESYNRVEGQGLNSPVSEKAAFAYATALKYLLSPANPNKKLYIGDATVVYWADSEDKGYANAFASLFDPEYGAESEPTQGERKRAEGRMAEVAEKIRHVQALNVEQLTKDLDKSTRFYVLGLAPNASRIAVRFFLSDPFGKFVDRMMQHYSDMKLVKEYDNQPDYITIGQILAETVSKKSQDKSPSPLLAGAVTRSILTGAPYPAALFYALINRLRADMDDPHSGIKKINYVRAAVIKAYLIRKYRNQSKYQEALVMALNEQSTIPAYLLGRLFAVLEKAQQEAIGDVNASIKDRYFTSACAAPASVFPYLLRLSQHHLSKAEYGYANDRRIQDILNLLDVEKNPIPPRLTLDEQGIFVLGYYHQRAAFFAHKNDLSTQSTVNNSK